MFVDVRPDTLNIDETLIEAAITPRTRAIVAVHYAGVACEMDAIMDIAARYGLLVIEDAAQAIMSTYRGRALGGIGHLGALSFHETKNLISGEVPLPDGSRQAYVFDHEQAGRVTSVLAAIQSQTQLNAAVELRLPTAPVPDDVALEYLEPVGERYAFVSDADAVRPLLTRRLARAADAVGDDVELLWAEESWVLATAPVESSADRLQELLADLAEVATALEQGQNAHT